ncbi:hypothetical protein A3A76_05865 [Candidatus Woesebacteria bacterium RIFCSPLOWO2_01_FULL_39_23]|uniref:PDZ domain-containing protein n=1 Tax=Candidatus Woesebacteria bacterium RIFCSPHIGHO2_01_FULL_40_22 TaxID=1802499 RepID=A0A1F7YJZ9_9BACT|nr:MAG: hypothetical protein A2141_02565 [Candidatus Woesebacteria bacterium RBG_16_40_11]OGM26928.1 MAG: hypothetical protein A2628_05810 [Candidatus Woesebacteria bacterium RIFCSPHIGHO2_01_FULL_40_22]OGM37337.1 MAG: hypothetical protein A3E41_04205 [Candidatus Woesebacteria bacterium RIFCSPHIGHO2_12_FULL_38_9]OGM63202.1 MAG: hypothetical protein A3A76_05865 [Candidatus Woesebacteria bacterium RIFCSPLOWO2_01_FULL_39_23]
MFTAAITFLLILSILVLVHEFGHFIAAKRAGVWVEEFGLGYPPRVYGRKIGETMYSINLFPIGGFVRLHGEQTEEGISKPKKAFFYKNKKKRFSILIAGVVMNFILAIVAFTVVYTFSGVPRETDKVIVSGIAKDSPAESAGIKDNDVIESVAGQEVKDIGKFIEIVETKKGEKITLGLKDKNGAERHVEVTPRINHPDNEGPIGVAVTQTEMYFPPIWKRPFLGVYNGFQEAIFWGETIVIGLFTVIKNLLTGVVPKDVAGPVGIFAMTSEVSKFGILAIINFLGVFSVNLAIINIVPFPALDGGRLFFLGIESLIGKKVVPKIEAAIHMAGMVVLILLIIAITIGDVRRLISAGSLSGFLENAVK